MAADDAAPVQRLSRQRLRAARGATIVNTLAEPTARPASTPPPSCRSPAPLAAFVGSGVIRDVANRLLRDFATCLAGRLNAPPHRRAPTSPPARPRPSELLAAARSRPIPIRPPDERRDTGICGGDVPPLIGDVLTGTGLTLAQAAARLERGEPLPA